MGLRSPRRVGAAGGPASRRPHAGTNQASQAFWHVKDVEREVAELRSKGVRLEEYDMPGLKNGIRSHPGGKAAWFKDTEGNILAPIQGA